MSTVLEVMPSSAALIVAVPFVTPVATPCEPGAFEIVATEVALEAHVTLFVRFCVVLSENVPVTEKSSLFPIKTNGPLGVTASDLSTAGLTLSTVDPVIPSSVALIVD